MNIKVKLISSFVAGLWYLFVVLHPGVGPVRNSAPIGVHPELRFWFHCFDHGLSFKKRVHLKLFFFLKVLIVSKTHSKMTSSLSSMSFVWKELIYNTAMINNQHHPSFEFPKNTKSSLVTYKELIKQEKSLPPFHLGSINIYQTHIEWGLLKNVSLKNCALL